MLKQTSSDIVLAFALRDHPATFRTHLVFRTPYSVQSHWLVDGHRGADPRRVENTSAETELRRNIVWRWQKTAAQPLE